MIENISSEENVIPEVTEKIINEAESNILKKSQKKIPNEIDKIVNRKDTALIKYEQKALNLLSQNF